MKNIKNQGDVGMAKHYLDERTDLYNQLIEEHQLTKEETECLEWVLDHISNKYLDAFLGMIKQPKRNERNAGRKPKDLPVPLEMVRMRQDSGESLESIATSYDISRATLYRLLKRAENE